MKDIQEKYISMIISEKGEIKGKIINLKNLSKSDSSLTSLNDNAKKILKLYLYNKQFINKINNSINEGELNQGYLIKKEFMDKIYQLDAYIYIESIIDNNKNIKSLFIENQNEDYNILFQKVLNEFDKEAINNINKSIKEIKIYTHLYKAEFNHLQLNNNNYSYITNNFIILNEEIYKLFAYSKDYCSNESYKYFYKTKKLFILPDKYQYKNTMLMCHLNDKNCFELKLN